MPFADPRERTTVLDVSEKALLTRIEIERADGGSGVRQRGEDVHRRRGLTRSRPFRCRERLRAQVSPCALSSDDAGAARAEGLRSPSLPSRSRIATQCAARMTTPSLVPNVARARSASQMESLKRSVGLLRLASYASAQKASRLYRAEDLRPRNRKPSNFFLNFETRPPVSTRRCEPPVHAGCALGSISRFRVSPSDAIGGAHFDDRFRRSWRR